jgi:hypothetical protein
MKALRRVALSIIALLVLLPSTAVSLVCTVFGFAAWSDGPRGGPYLTWFAAPIVLLCGWFGLISLWQMYFALSNRRLTASPKLIWLGLACGCASSAALIYSLGGSLSFKVVLFGWPLLAAVPLGVGFARSPHLVAKTANGLVDGSF